MNTMKKRILSGVIAIATAASMAVPAFADSTTVVTGAYEQGTIDVVVPDTGTAVINPYGLGTSVQDSEGNKVSITGQIATAPIAIKNQSLDMDLSIGASVTTKVTTGEGGTAMKLEKTSTKAVPADPDDPDSVAIAAKTTKSAYVVLQVVTAPDSVSGDEADGTDPVNIDDLVITAYADSASWTNAKSLVLDTLKAAEMENMATIKRAKAVTDGTGDTKLYNYDKGSVALVRLTGDCVASPKTGTWTTDDKFEATIVFTFTPVEAVASGD